MRAYTASDAYIYIDIYIYIYLSLDIFYTASYLYRFQVLQKFIARCQIHTWSLTTSHRCTTSSFTMNICRKEDEKGRTRRKGVDESKDNMEKQEKWGEEEIEDDGEEGENGGEDDTIRISIIIMLLYYLGRVHIPCCDKPVQPLDRREGSLVSTMVVKES